MKSSRISGNGCLAKICWRKDQFSGQMLLQNVEHHKFYPFYFQIPYVFFTALAMAASVAIAPCVARPMLLSGEKKMPLTDWWSKLEGGTAEWHRECEWHGSPSLLRRSLLNWMILKWWWLTMCDFHNHGIISWTTTFETCALLEILFEQREHHIVVFHANQEMKFFPTWRCFWKFY